MCGIYLHIPFCKQACHYCNFHFSTSLKLQNDFLEALLKETELRKDYTEGESVTSIYFGGGTPSLLRSGDLELIISTLKKTYPVSPYAEVTLEANPDDITSEALRSWKQIGINRLSIGIQSFFEEDLRWMNRAHSASQAAVCIPLAREAGFTNVTIDLIYGGPTLSDEKWKQNLSTAVSFRVPHLSCYALTVESKTPLDSMIKKKVVQNVSADDQARQFQIMLSFLEENGYEQYEISNFSLPGKRSIHNSSYWSSAKYIGFGPSAHSYNGISRQWNVANNALYIQSLKNNSLQFEQEMLTSEQRFNEYIMTSLRTMEGADLLFIQNAFGKEYSEQLKKNAVRFFEKRWMKIENEKLKGAVNTLRDGQ
ncbi:MAG: radical SAM family heme chaperone HemW, partial [Flavitalea sp.]